MSLYTVDLILVLFSVVIKILLILLLVFVIFQFSPVVLLDCMQYTEGCERYVDIIRTRGVLVERERERVCVTSRPSNLPQGHRDR